MLSGILKRLIDFFPILTLFQKLSATVIIIIYFTVVNFYRNHHIYIFGDTDFSQFWYNKNQLFTSYVLKIFIGFKRNKMNTHIITITVNHGNWTLLF